MRRWTLASLTLAVAAASTALAGERSVTTPKEADGYRGIWYFNQPSGDKYKYKYSGGLGTYCAKHLPLAVYAEEANKTFFVYGGTSKGRRNLLEMVAYYDHATGTLPRPRVLRDKRTSDAHDNPVLALDPKGHLWVFCSAHGTARPSYLYRSVEPYAIDAFELVWETNFSYPQPWWIEGKGFLFLHTLYRKGRILHWATSPDGRTWSEARRLAAIPQGHYQVSWRHGTRVGTAFNTHPRGKGVNWRTNLYYLETPDFGQTWRTAHGETLETPLTEIRNPALVHDYQAEGLLVYLKDINFDAEGRPVVLYVTSKGYQAGPENNPRTWTTARWTGSQWDIQGHIVSDSNYDTGCLHIEADGTWRLIAPAETGPQPFNPGGEVAIWTSTDQGKTWHKLRQLTRQSPYNHTYCRRPVDAHPDFYALWADGHGRQPSPSRLYFCDRTGQRVLRLPPQMEGPTARPQPVE
ncbi:MAG: BNR-4 repeat-containing protein [Candidatus Brocadiia bacterium]